MKDEAEAGFECPGVLLDGEVVLAEVRCLEKGLANLGADAEVLGEVLFDANGIVIGHAGLGFEALSATRGGTECC